MGGVNGGQHQDRAGGVDDAHDGDRFHVADEPFLSEGVAGPEEGAADQNEQPEAEGVRETGEFLMEKDEEADGENADANPLPSAEMLAEPADGTEDDEQRGELDDDLGGGGRSEAEAQEEAKVVGGEADQGDQEEQPATVGEVLPGGEVTLIGEQGSHADSGDEVAAPSDGDGIDDFNDGSESDGERAPQGGREHREHKAQTKLHYRLF